MFYISSSYLGGRHKNYNRNEKGRRNGVAERQAGRGLARLYGTVPDFWPDLLTRFLPQSVPLSLFIPMFNSCFRVARFPPD